MTRTTIRHGITIASTALSLIATTPLAASPASGTPGEMRALYRAMIRDEAARAGLPPDIAEAVVSVESGFDPTKIGGVGEIGLMQVRPETAAMLGFNGSDGDLAKPDTNIHYGVAYLSKAWTLAGGHLCRALMKYRAGHGEETMSPLSVLYCRRAVDYLAAEGSPFAGQADVDFPVMDPAPSGSGAGKPPAAVKPGRSLLATIADRIRQQKRLMLRISRSTHVDERLNTQLRKLGEQVEALNGNLKTARN